jgi:hypothetical protein
MEGTIGIFEHEPQGVAIARAVTECLRVARAKYIKQVHHVALARAVVPQKPGCLVTMLRLGRVRGGSLLDNEKLVIENPARPDLMVHRVARDGAFEFPDAGEMFDEFVVPLVRGLRDGRARREREHRDHETRGAAPSSNVLHVQHETLSLQSKVSNA